MVEDHCRGGEVAVTDEIKGKLAPGHRQRVPGAPKPHPLDISLQLLQMLGPLAFLVGRPDGSTAPRLPSFL